MYDRSLPRIAIRWFRYTLMAFIARGLSETVPTAGGGGHHGAGNLEAGGSAGDRRPHRGCQRRASVSGGGTIAPDWCAHACDPAGTDGPQYRAGNRRRGIAGHGGRRRPATVGAAI